MPRSSLIQGRDDPWFLCWRKPIFDGRTGRLPLPVTDDVTRTLLLYATRADRFRRITVGVRARPPLGGVHSDYGHAGLKCRARAVTYLGESKFSNWPTVAKWLIAATLQKKIARSSATRRYIGDDSDSSLDEESKAKDSSGARDSGKSSLRERFSSLGEFTLNCLRKKHESVVG